MTDMKAALFGGEESVFSGIMIVEKEYINLARTLKIIVQVNEE